MGRGWGEGVKRRKRREQHRTQNKRKAAVRCCRPITDQECKAIAYNDQFKNQLKTQHTPVHSSRCRTGHSPIAPWNVDLHILIVSSSFQHTAFQAQFTNHGTQTAQTRVDVPGFSQHQPAGFGLGCTCNTDTTQKKTEHRNNMVNL